MNAPVALLLDLTRIRGRHEHVDRCFPAGSVEAPDDEFRVMGDVTLAFDIHKEERVVHLVGTVHAKLEVPCSRCLEPITAPVDETFDLRYFPAALSADGQEQELAEKDLDLGYYSGEVIDLGELVRERFYLILPMKPLCRSDCQGLCPECGAQRNTTRCGCEYRWIDPRLAALEHLIPKEPTGR